MSDDRDIYGLSFFVFGDMPNLRGALCAGSDPHDNPRQPNSIGPANSRRYKDAVLYAKSVCAECRHEQTCADWATPRATEVGIWGGLTEDERQAIRVARMQEQAA